MFKLFLQLFVSRQLSFLRLLKFMNKKICLKAILYGLLIE